MSKKEETSLQEEIKNLQQEMETNKARFNLIKNIIAILIILILITGLLCLFEAVQICILLLVIISGLAISLFVL